MQIKSSLKEDLKKKVYLIVYDLGNKKENPEALLAEIKKFPGWCKAWDGHWFVCSSEKAVDICARLQKLLKPSDYLFVCDANSDRMGKLPAKAADWLDEIVRKQQ